MYIGILLSNTEVDSLIRTQKVRGPGNCTALVRKSGP